MFYFVNFIFVQYQKKQFYLKQAWISLIFFKHPIESSTTEGLHALITSLRLALFFTASTIQSSWASVMGTLEFSSLALGAPWPIVAKAQTTKKIKTFISVTFDSRNNSRLYKKIFVRFLKSLNLNQVNYN